MHGLRNSRMMVGAADDLTQQKIKTAEKIKDLTLKLEHLDSMRRQMAPRICKEDRKASMKHIVSECSARIRKKMIENGKLYTGITCCRAKDFIEL
ncbi:hypothetical protein PR048_003481 [Dryococelus australis]|uniref:Uncharacterized protein n=1 Tax=Dryococelus australis TaxID=614101 RepID=A0ABQ9IN90_9NEOP|nr:hypothetical protein PR048_003481 [Dryococelus australis]